MSSSLQESPRGRVLISYDLQLRSKSRWSSVFMIPSYMYPELSSESQPNCAFCARSVHSPPMLGNDNLACCY
jgi:hypothetical protein